MDKLTSTFRQVDSFIATRKTWDLIKKLRDIQSFQSIDNYERIILILFYASQQYSITLSERILFQGILDEHLFDSWEYQMKQVYKEDRERFKVFVNELFGAYAQSPFVYVSNEIVLKLIRKYLYNDRDKDFILSLEELQEINVGYLEKYLKEAKEVEENCFYIYRSCFKEIVGEKLLVKLLPQADILFRTFILGNHEVSYLAALIVPSHEIMGVSIHTPKHRMKRLLAFAEQPFVNYKEKEGQYGGFEQFLEETTIKYPNSTAIDDFNKFYELYKANGYEAVEFGKEE